MKVEESVYSISNVSFVNKLSNQERNNERNVHVVSDRFLLFYISELKDNYTMITQINSNEN